MWSSNPNTVYTPGFGQRANGADGFYQPDWLGSTRTLTDSTGATVAAQSYEAWGSRDQVAPGSPNWPTDLQFAGAWGYQSEYSNLPNEPGLGLDYLQQRYYDPVVGRFMEPDPLGYAAGTNLFEYAEDDPVNGVDPFGLCLKKPDNRNIFQKLWDSLGQWWKDRQDAAQAAALQEYISEQLELGRNVLADGFSDDSFLTRQMQRAFNNQDTVNEYDDLVEKFERGIKSPGLRTGNGSLGKGVFYLRGDRGTRIFLRQLDQNVYEVLGIANKKNENAVIQYLRELYQLR